MKRISIITLYLVYSWCIFVSAETEQEAKSILTEKLATTQEAPHELTQGFMRANYQEKPIPQLVNELAAQMDTNIVLPQDVVGADRVFYESKFTFKSPDKLTIEQTWEIVLDSLNLLGYTAFKQGDMIRITSNKKTVSLPATFYRNVPPSELPQTEQVIRYVYYLKHLSLIPGSEGNVPGIRDILKGMLSSDKAFQLIEKNNAILITDKASAIKAAMKIIVEIDEGGLRDAIEVIPIYYTSASLIEDLFSKEIFFQPSRTGIQQKETPNIPYFPQNTKVLALRGNSIVIMGTTRSIDIVKDFIIKYIDRPLEAGESMLHLYDLQYLNAQDFADVLKKIIGGEDQQQQVKRKTKKETGPEQYFEDVVIVAELTSKPDTLTPEKEITTIVKQAESREAGGRQVGGNRLIIASRKNDWLRIKSLIEKLDRPQLQVAIDTLILDVTLDQQKILGAQTRNKSGFNNSTSDAVNWQAAHLGEPVLKPDLPPDALMANLLELMKTGTGMAINLATASAPGSFLISFDDKDTGVWGVLQMLNAYTNTTVLAQPFLVTQNHKPAWVFTEENRFLVSDTEGGTGQIARVNFEYVSAGITLDVLPHISETGVVNMQIIIQINQFLPGPTTEVSPKVNRVIQTNANVGNGEVLVLGGLTRTDEIVEIRESPLLGQVPLLGWFFKRKSKEKRKVHLMVLISPTIIEPHLQGGVNTFTEDKLNVVREDLRDELNHVNTRDPITRWFFKPNCECPDEDIEHYLEQDYYEPEEKLSAQVVQEREARWQKNQEEEEKELQQEQEEYLKKLLEHEQNPLSTFKQV